MDSNKKLIQRQRLFKNCGGPTDARFLKISGENIFLLYLTIPLLLAILFPIAILDLLGSILQMLCFAPCKIPKVKRSDYIHLDSDQLSPLSRPEKIHMRCQLYMVGAICFTKEIGRRLFYHFYPKRSDKNEYL